MKIIKRGNGNEGHAQTQRRTKDSVEHPRRRHDRNAGITLQSYILPITALMHLHNPDICPKIRVPSIMDAQNLPDMGRMNRIWFRDVKAAAIAVTLIETAKINDIGP